MRESCIECVCKHVGQAAVLIHECKKGYAHHFVYAIGHLAEAEDEAVKLYPEIAERIYAIRKSFQRGEEIDLDNLVSDLYELWTAEV